MPEKKVFHNIINGEIQQSADGAMMDIINPATGEAYASAPNSSAVDVDQAFQAAGAAFAKWRWSTPSERQRALLKLADVIEGSAGELVAIESENTGKPVGLTLSEEIPPMVDQIRFFAAPPACSRASPRASTCAGSRPRSAGSRSGRSARSRPGTTR